MSILATQEPQTLLADDEPLFEIIDGVRVEIPHMSAFASILASVLLADMHLFARAHDIGVVVMETLFHLALPVNRNRRPDVALVSYQRWPKEQPKPESDNAWDVVPDLAVEVVSPHDLAEEILEKIGEYFRAGVQAAWVVYPRQRVIHTYDAWNIVRVLTDKDTLEGGKVLPGFRLPLGELFQAETGGAQNGQS